MRRRPKLLKCMAVAGLVDICLLVVSLLSQTAPGTVTQSSVATVTATAGVVVCNISSSTPAAATGIHVQCNVSGVRGLTMDATIPVGANGFSGTYIRSGNVITWLVTLPDASGRFAWQVAATADSTPTTSASGTF